jgi:hypothetical protein
MAFNWVWDLVLDEEGRENEGKDTLDSGTADAEFADVAAFAMGTKRFVYQAEY